MGYYVNVVESNLVVNKERAINCIKKLMESGHSYAWVHSRNVHQALDRNCLGDALNEFGYETIANPDNKEEVEVYRDRADAKWGDDEELLLGLTAAYSRECFIGFRGEDGEMWGYGFDGNGNHKELTGKLVWE